MATASDGAGERGIPLSARLTGGGNVPFPSSSASKRPDKGVFPLRRILKAGAGGTFPPGNALSPPRHVSRRTGNEALAPRHVSKERGMGRRGLVRLREAQGMPPAFLPVLQETRGTRRSLPISRLVAWGTCDSPRPAPAGDPPRQRAGPVPTRTGPTRSPPHDVGRLGPTSGKIGIRCKS